MTMLAALPDQSTVSLVKRVVRAYLSPYKSMVFVALIFMLIIAATTGAIAQLMSPVLDQVLIGKDQNAILPIGLAVFVSFFIRGIASYAASLMMSRVGQAMIADMQKDLFAHMLKLDLTFFHNISSGQLISRVVNDINGVKAAVSDCLTTFGRSLITLLFLIGVMIYQDVQLSLAALAVFPLAAGFVAYLSKRIRDISKALQQELGVLTSHLSQIFQGIKQVQAYNAEKFESLRANKIINSVRKKTVKSVQVGTLSTPVNETLVGIFAAAIIIYGGYRILDGEITGGQLVAFLTAFTMAYEPMKKLAKLNNTVQMGMGAAERVFAILDTPPGIQSSENALPFCSRTPEISFQDIAFQYDGAEENAINGISFKTPSGKTTALVGASGSGKTTIISLVPRFYDVTSGSIEIDGTDIRLLDLEDLRKHISLVSQDVTIFEDTIAANIAYGQDGCEMNDIIEAAKKAAAHEFIMALPEQYDTQTGENGVKLSGGQRQRIAIARALLRDTPILLLDEATSALDNESEALVQQAIERLKEGRTTLVIAHRLSTVQDADQIIVLDRGRIAEQGTHNDLITARGIYANMYHAGLKTS